MEGGKALGKGVGRTTGKSPRKGEKDTEDIRYGQSQAGYQPSFGRKGGSQLVLRVTQCQALCSM